jgi:predicted nuclease of predicted toxin-antitoxin system
MIFWVDAQLPPALAGWLAETFHVEAYSVKSLGLRDAADMEIFQAAAAKKDVVVISKDSDFVDLISRLGTPPQLLWITCGNVTNRRLRQLLTATWLEVTRLLVEGEAIVEVAEQD